MRGASPYPTQEEARRRFTNRRLKLLQNALLWRKHAGELFGIGNLISHLIEDSVSAFQGRMNDLEKEGVKNKLRNMVPSELLPAAFK